MILLNYVEEEGDRKGELERVCEGFTERGEEEEVRWWCGLLRREEKGLEGGAPRVLGFIKSVFIVCGRTKGLRGNFVFHQTQNTLFFFSKQTQNTILVHV